MTENKTQKFGRIATPRFQKAVDRLEQVLKMINSPSYDVSEEQKEKLLTILNEMLEKYENALSGKGENIEVEL